MRSQSSRAREPVAEHGCTVPSERRDFPEWHRGRPRFAVWAIALHDAGVDERLRELRGALGGLLLPGDEREPHITLHICGFPVATPDRHDDYALTDLSAQVDALSRARFGSFDLTIGDAFTFASAACLSVHDGAGSLHRLRSICQRAAPGSDRTRYVPHVTAGLYAGSWPLRQIHLRLRSARPSRPLPMRVGSLDWMCYASSRIGGPLRTLLRVNLDSGQVHVPDGDLLRAVFGAARAHPDTTGA